MEKNLKYLLIDELNDIFNAEEQLLIALPKMAAAAESSDLKNAFLNHLKETKEQVTRLQKIFKIMAIPQKKKTCQAMKGLIQEGQEVIKEFNKSAVRDAALISKAQRIEHYEISAYGTARAFANELSFNDVADLLKETEKEESNADKNLSKIAEGGILSAGINQNAINEQEELPKRKTSDKQKSSGFMSQFEIQEEPPLKKKTATATKSRTSKATPSKKPVKVTAQKKTSNQEKKKFALPKTSVAKETTTRSFLRG